VSEKVHVGKQQYILHRAKLKRWLVLEDTRSSIKEAADSGDEQLAELIFSYLSVAFDVQDIGWSSLPWLQVAELYTTALTVNLPRLSFPILQVHVKDEREVAWDYDGRTWYLWSHMIMSSYSWTLNYVSKLDIDDALALIQEILIEEQTAKEWDWSLSEIAYPYNESTKKSEFKPLEKPEWMRVQGEIKPIKKIKILRKHMPIGNVVKLGGEKDAELV